MLPNISLGRLNPWSIRRVILVSKPQPVPSMIIISLLSQKQMSWPFTVCQFLEWFPDVCVSVSWMTSGVQLNRDSRIEDRRPRYRFIARLFASQFFHGCLPGVWRNTSSVSTFLVNFNDLISFCHHVSHIILSVSFLRKLLCGHTHNYRWIVL